ncbi:MAG: DMT family transporter [Candidatus Obscuribacterales bacterium]|nr:DMT family transporter [Candidatus Obscuribacterales bacterium]
MPALAVVASIVSLTVGTSFGKSLFAEIGPQGTATMRVVFAAAILLTAWRPRLSEFSASNLRAIALYGATLGLMNTMFYMSLATLPIGIAIAIEFTGPLALAVTASRRIIDYVWVGFAVAGLLLLIPFPQAGGSAVALNPVGIGFAFASAILWALYILFGQRLGHIHAGHAMAIGMVVASMVVLPVGIAVAGTRLLDPSLLTAGFTLAIFSSAIPYSLEMYSLKRLPKQTFGILLSLEPAIGALSGMFVLNEKLTVLQWIAIGSVMIASIGSATGTRGREGELPVAGPEV